MSDGYDSEYIVNVDMCWMATSISPVTNEEIVAYADTVEGARRKVNMIVFREAVDRGLRIVSTSPLVRTVGGRQV